MNIQQHFTTDITDCDEYTPYTVFIKNIYKTSLQVNNHLDGCGMSLRHKLRPREQLPDDSSILQSCG